MGNMILLSIIISIFWLIIGAAYVGRKIGRWHRASPILAGACLCFSGYLFFSNILGKSSCWGTGCIFVAMFVYGIGVISLGLLIGILWGRANSKTAPNPNVQATNFEPGSGSLDADRRFRHAKFIVPAIVTFLVVISVASPILIFRILGPKEIEAEVVPDTYLLTGGITATKPEDLIAFSYGGKWGYADRLGQVLVPPKFEKARAFSSNRRAAFARNNKYGFIDTQGVAVVSPRYDAVGDFSADQLAVVKYTLDWGKFSGYINTYGTPVIPKDYDDARDFSNGLAAVKGSKGSWGYIDVEGKEVISMQYFDVKDFVGGLAPVIDNRGSYMLWGFINIQGQKIGTAQYEDAQNFSNGLAAVKRGGKWGYIDAEARELILPLYDYADGFTANGLAAVARNGKYGYVDAQGRERISLQFDFAYRFSNNGLAVVKRKKKWGYLDAHGKEVIPFQFDEAQPFSSNGLAFVVQNGEPELIDAHGKRMQAFDEWIGEKWSRHYERLLLILKNL